MKATPKRLIKLLILSVAVMAVAATVNQQYDTVSRNNTPTNINLRAKTLMVYNGVNIVGAQTNWSSVMISNVLFLVGSTPGTGTLLRVAVDNSVRGVTMGSGMSFDGLTLSAVGTNLSAVVNGSGVASDIASLSATNTLILKPPVNTVPGSIIFANGSAMDFRTLPSFWFDVTNATLYVPGGLVVTNGITGIHTTGMPKFRQGVANIDGTADGTLWLVTNAASTANFALAGSDAGRTILNGSSSINFASGGIYRWVIDASGHLLANVDNTYDIGSAAANRPRNVSISADLRVGAAQYLNRHATNASFTLTTNHHLYAWTSTSAGTITLPSATVCSNFYCVIKDEAGNAAVNNITISAPAGGSIDGVASYVLNGNYAAIRIYSAGVTNGWFTAD